MAKKRNNKQPPKPPQPKPSTKEPKSPQPETEGPIQPLQQNSTESNVPEQFESAKERALQALEERQATKPEQIKNESLHAGEPMYFYCTSCGWLADTKPENYTDVPKRLCSACQALKDAGWLPEKVLA